MGTLFGISEDHLEHGLSLDRRLIKNRPATFFFRVEGRAMSPLVTPGDILIVDRSLEIISNRLVVVSVNGEFLCRRFVRSWQGVLLRTDNLDMKDLQITEEMEVIFFGVVTAIIRELV